MGAHEGRKTNVSALNDLGVPAAAERTDNKPKP